MHYRKCKWYPILCRPWWAIHHTRGLFAGPSHRWVIRHHRWAICWWAIRRWAIRWWAICPGPFAGGPFVVGPFARGYLLVGHSPMACGLTHNLAQHWCYYTVVTPGTDTLDSTQPAGQHLLVGALWADTNWAVFWYWCDLNNTLLCQWLVMPFWYDMIIRGMPCMVVRDAQGLYAWSGRSLRPD